MKNTTKWKSTVWICLFLLIGLPGTHAQDEANPIHDMHAKGWLAIIEGDNARDRGKLADAKTNYASALKIYQDIQTKDATFQADKIAYRVTYCENQIAALEDPAVGNASDGDFKKKYATLLDETEVLRRRLAELDTSDKAGSLATKEATDRLKQQNETLQAQLKQLQSASSQQAGQPASNNAAYKSLQERYTKLKGASERLVVRYRDVESELTTLKASSSPAEVAGKIKQLEGNLAAASGDLEKTSRQLKAREQELAAARAAMSTEAANRDQQMAQLKKEQEAAEETVRTLRKEIALLASNSSHGDTQRTQQTAEMEALRKQTGTLDKQLAQIQTERDQLAREKATAMDVAKSAEAQLSNANTEAQKAVAALAKERDEASRELDKVKQAYAALENTRKESSGSMEEKDRQLAASKEQASRAQKVLDRAQTELDAQRKQQEASSELLAVTNTELKALRETSKTAEQKVADLNVQLTALAEARAKADAELSTKGDSLDKLNLSNIQVQKKLAEIRTSEAAKRKMLEAELKTAQEQSQHAEADLGKALNQLLAMQNAETDAKAQLSAHAKELETLRAKTLAQGQEVATINTQVKELTASRQAALESTAAQSADLDKLTLVHGRIQSELAGLKAREAASKDELKQALDKAQAEVAALKTRETSSVAQVEKIQTELKTLIDSKTDLEKRLATQAKALKDSESRYTNAGKDLAVARQQIAAYKAQIDQAPEPKKFAEQEKSLLRASEALEDARAQIALLETERKTRSKEITTLQSQLVEAERKQLATARVKETHEGERATLAKEVADLKSSLAEARNMRESAGGELAQLTDERELLTAQLTQARGD
ncbi:MAG: chromosome segregation ATPase, partial [Kiritimatiellia bacterium]